MKLRSIIAMSLSAALAFTIFGMSGCASNSSSNATSASSASSNGSTSTMTSRIPEATLNFSQDELMSGKHHAVVYVEGYDPIEIELDADSAPISVTNFVNLANEDYYNGLTFYRVVEDFCLQGGTSGNSASGTDNNLGTITGEFSSNGVSNPLADNFERGTVAMARTQLPNSATSTFFITLGTNDMVGTSLDGQYAAFGTIDENGMATVDKIVSDTIGFVDDEYMGSISDEKMQPVITRIEILD